MPSNYDLPRIAAWVAGKLPKGHAFSESPSAVECNISNSLCSMAYLRDVAIAESLLLDALAESSRLVGLQAPTDYDNRWCADIYEDEGSINGYSGDTKLLALLASVQAIVEGEANATDE